MPFLRKTWTLVQKNLILSWKRHWLSCLIVVFLAPVIFFFFIAYSKNFFVPPANYGVGTPAPLRSLADAVAFAGGNRNTLGIVTNGLGPEVQQIIDDISPALRAGGVNPVVVETDDEILTICPSTVRGTTPCFAGVRFESTPSNGSRWSYVIRADGAFRQNIFVDRDTNDAQIYVLPLQYAIDNAIAIRSGANPLPLPENYMYTSSTSEERDRNVTRLYMNSLINVIAIAYFIGLVGILYQLTGQMATERELGISQLIEVMTARKRNWEAQAMRILSYHISYDILYAPGWIFIGAIVCRLNFPSSSTGLLIGFFLLTGLSLSSWAIFCAGFFKKAQLSGITVTLVSVVLGIIAQIQTPTSSGAIIITGLLFPPMNFLYFTFFVAYHERINLGAVLSDSPPGAPWQVPGYAFWIFAVIHILAYPFLGAFVERWLYGTTSRARSVQRTGGDATETVKIIGLTKAYRPSKFSAFMSRLFRNPEPETVVAVDNLSMSIRNGELSVLLGANGAGKSTTMDMLAGLQAPTGGTIEIDGSSIGICPQKNVLWDELTCEEHVWIFNSLKSSTRDSATVNRDLLISCDLKQKLKAKSQTLSGGQKRKLQLAMMLTGGSNLCLLDEVSSGLDPLSRRKIWDILLKERGNRSLLFSTHFLDEADYLSDTITVLSKGKLVAMGSSVELKQVHGGGYRVKIYNTSHFAEPAEWAKLDKHIHNDHVEYQLPDSAAATAFSKQLEDLGVTEYRVDGPTVEDVFLKLAAEAKAALATAAPTDHALDVPPLEKSASMASDEKALDLRPGRRLSLVGQTWVLFRKRITILKRNVFPYACAVLIPIVCAGLITLFLQGFEKLSCAPREAVRPSAVYNLATVATILQQGLKIPFGPPDALSPELLRILTTGGPGNLTEAFQPVTSLTALNDFIATNYSTTFPGGFFLDPSSGPTFAWRGNNLPGYALLVMNLMNNAQLDGQPLIQTGYQAFDRPFTPNTGDSLQAVLYFGLCMCIYPAFFALYPTQEKINKVRALHWSNGVRVLPLWTAYALFDLCFVLIVSAACAIVYATIADQIYFSSYLFLIFMLYGVAAMLLSYILCTFCKSQLAAFAVAAGYQLSSFLIYFLAYLLIVTFAPAADITGLVTIAHFAIATITPSGNLLRALLLSYNQFSLLCDGQQVNSNAGDMTVFGGPILYLILHIIIFFLILLAIESGWRPPFPRLRNRNPSHDPETDIGEAVDAEVLAEKSRVETCSDELRVQHVSKRFGSNLAVDDNCFAVPRNQVFALLGPNGAGKSTTFGIIRGDVRPTGSGDVLIEGISIVKDRAGARVHQGVCPQFDAMDAMTVTEHLEFYARARGVREVSHNVDAVIAAVGLEAYRRRIAGTLSGGNKRKLSLAIALVGDPTVLLIDEGSSGMDAAAKRVMWRTLREVSTGRSMVISTHAMEEADALAGRVGIMARRMLAIGSSDGLRRRYGDMLNVHVVRGDAPNTSADEMERLFAWVQRTFPGAVVEDRAFHGQVRFGVPNRRPRGAAPRDEAGKTRDLTGESSSADTLSLDPSLSPPPPPAVPPRSEARPDPCPPNDGVADAGIASLFAKLEAAREELGIAFFAVNQPTLDSVFLSIVEKHKVQEENYNAERGEGKSG
ncbi:ATP-binding cassette sub-family A member 1 [Sphaceloma murrayae]|uniref:ATP-binding cassette sub-family A member 1 n=1 Tax=Sphaceloma murrayae TaxID=2082308 RepID=A0A2K1QHP6_9PEZI|nr:ATP-binding cassette sub-family A member 1 [Sphaceloma murrayae]